MFHHRCLAISLRIYNSWRYRKTTLAAKTLIERVQSDEEYAWARGASNAGTIEKQMHALEGAIKENRFISDFLTQDVKDVKKHYGDMFTASVKVVTTKIGEGVAALEASCARLHKMHRASLA